MGYSQSLGITETLSLFQHTPENISSRQVVTRNKLSVSLVLIVRQERDLSSPPG